MYAEDTSRGVISAVRVRTNNSQKSYKERICLNLSSEEAFVVESSSEFQSMVVRMKNEFL